VTDLDVEFGQSAGKREHRRVQVHAG
jgi:hypothetical protein